MEKKMDEKCKEMIHEDFFEKACEGIVNSVVDYLEKETAEEDPKVFCEALHMCKK